MDAYILKVTHPHCRAIPPVLPLVLLLSQVEALPYVGVIAGAPSTSNSLVPMGEFVGWIR